MVKKEKEFALKDKDLAYDAGPDIAITFYHHSQAGSRAYDAVLGGRYHFFIPDRSLEELTTGRMSTQDMMQKLENLWPGADFMLQKCDISPEALRLALKDLRISELEHEVSAAYSTIRNTKPIKIKS